MTRSANPSKRDSAPEGIRESADAVESSYFTSDLRLPGGYRDAQGALHRAVELRPLLGREEELLATREGSGAERVTELLSRCVLRLGDICPVSKTVTRDLLVGDRQYLLLVLRRLTFGDRVQSVVSCPWRDCGKPVDIDFHISQLPIDESEASGSVYQVSRPVGTDSKLCALAGQTETLSIRFRLPTGADQEALTGMDAANPASLALALLARCVVQMGTLTHPTPDDIAALPAELCQWLEQQMERRAASPDLEMQARCPECGREFCVPFEIQDFFFGELHINADVLWREVHYLAFHYHWSESEIMTMPRERRRNYIDILAEEIERINEDVH